MLVAPGVRRALAPNSSAMTGPGTNTYLVGGREVSVVDPGPDLPGHVDAILDAVAANGGQVSALLVTHGHPDHLPAAYRLRRLLNRPIYGHPAVPEIDRPLADGTTVVAGDVALTVLETPGHAADHVCFWIETDRLLFSGDLISGAGTVVLGEERGSLARYLASLKRVEALGPSTILPGHGPVLPDGLAKIREYLAHRAERDRQIIDALCRGPLRVEQLVERLYQETPRGLYPMAARNVRAHLEKLAAEGVVNAQDGVWTLRLPPRER